MATKNVCGICARLGNTCCQENDIHEPADALISAMGMSPERALVWHWQLYQEIFEQE